MDLENILVTLLGAVVGALLSFWLPYIERARKNRAHLNLVGTWKSSYLIENTADWVNEDLEISFKRSRFHLRSTGNPRGDFYEATATLNEGELTGNWRSKNGRNRGSLLLAIRPQHGLLYGYYTGAQDNGGRVFAAWVLGKIDDDIKQGKKLLQEQTLDIGNG